MNRLGILVDLSHVHESTFWNAVRLSKRPVIASHSCGRALCDLPHGVSGADAFPVILEALARRGMPDATLRKLAWDNALRVLDAA